MEEITLESQRSAEQGQQLEGIPSTDCPVPAPAQDSPNENLPVAESPRGEIEGMAVPEWAVKLQHEMQAFVAETVRQILHAFEQKLAYDRGKEEQISRLHEELQTYKADLLAKTNRPFIMGLIRMHDDLAKVAQDIRQRGPEGLTPEKVAELLEGFQEDIEILLEQHGVVAYREQDERFDPRRQTALRTVPTGDPDQVGIIASVLRPGFKQDGVIVQKERVAVYALSKELLEPNKSEGQDVSAEGGGDQKGAGNE